MSIAVVFDIDGVLRDVSQSYRRALADTVEAFTQRWVDPPFRPTADDIDLLKQEGRWNNDWRASQEFIYRTLEKHGQQRQTLSLDYSEIVAYFQNRYRGQGNTPQTWDGYITQEPLLVSTQFFQQFLEANIHWGFFSGATRASATYVLTERIGLTDPILFAMEDGPEKPDPTGLFWVIEQLSPSFTTSLQTVAYCGDTNADMQVIRNARITYPQMQWLAIGILPPHLSPEKQPSFRDQLQQAGADLVLAKVTDLTPALLKTL
jgi:HAD superfamily phosphatase